MLEFKKKKENRIFFVNLIIQNGNDIGMSIQTLCWCLSFKTNHFAALEVPNSPSGLQQSGMEIVRKDQEHDA